MDNCIRKCAQQQLFNCGDENLQQVPFQGQHNCHLITSTNETQRNIHWWILTFSLSAKPRPCLCSSMILTQRIWLHYGFRSSVWLWEVHYRNSKASFTAQLFTEWIQWYVPERLWEEVYMAIISKLSHMDGPEKLEKGKQCCFNTFNINLHIYINLL